MNTISPLAQIGSGNKFGTGVVVGDSVSIGDNNYLGNFISIEGNISIGSGNFISNHVTIGGFSRLFVKRGLAWEDKAQYPIRIGDGNFVGECVTIHLPMERVTEIRNNSAIGAHSHIAHDVLLEDDVITTIHCKIGGYSHILQGANLGIGVSVHPRTIVGQYAMCGMGAVIVRHILPGATVVGNPARYLQVNQIGLSRNGFTEKEVRAVKLFLESDTPLLERQTTLPARLQRVFQHFFDTLAAKGRKKSTIPQLPSGH